MQLYLYCEKRLLRARGLLTNELRRTPVYTPDADSVRYVDELNERILETLGEPKLPATALIGNASGQDE